MAVSTIKATLDKDIETVWKIVTSLTEYQWRSDLSKIEVLSENQFVEYTKDGYGTTFTVTACEPCKRWEFDMENSNMTGHWVGQFEEKGDKTEITFTEDVTARKVILKPLVGIFLKKQQARYVEDLRKAGLNA